MKHEQRHCPACDRGTLHTKKATGFGCLPNLFLTVVSFGLWLPVAILTMGFASLGNAVESWHCTECVTRPASERDTAGVSLGRVLFVLAAVFGFFAWAMSQ